MRYTVAWYAVLAVRIIQCVLSYEVPKEKKNSSGLHPRVIRAEILKKFGM